MSPEPKKLIVPVAKPAAALSPHAPARLTNPQPKKPMVSSADPSSQSKKLAVPVPEHTHQPKKVIVAATKPAAVEIAPILEPLPKQSSVPAPVPTVLAPQITTTPRSTETEEMKQRELTSQIPPSTLPKPVESPFPRSTPPKPPTRPRPPPAPLSGDRSILRQVGERARLQSTAASAMLGSEERKRLVMKGRKLLERARESGLNPDALKASTASVRESIASRLRSRAPTASAETAKRPPPPPPPKPVAVPQHENSEEEEEVDGETDDGGAGWDFDF